MIEALKEEYMNGEESAETVAFVSENQQKIHKLVEEIDSMHARYKDNPYAEHIMDLKAELVDALDKIEKLPAEIEALGKATDEDIKNRTQKGWEILALKKRSEELEKNLIPDAEQKFASTLQ